MRTVTTRSHSTPLVPDECGGHFPDKVGGCGGSGPVEGNFADDGRQPGCGGDPGDKLEGALDGISHAHLEFWGEFFSLIKTH